MKPESRDLYLSAIYHLQERRETVTTSSLAQELGVAMASVSEMLRKLGERGLVDYAPYRPVTLTEEGRLRAAKLVRRHRLWEVFLVEKLDMSWENVYREACHLEHATSDEVADALEEFLGHPTVEVHGYAIPTSDGESPALPESVPLTTLEAGQSGRILQVSERTPELLAYLKEMNLIPGQVVEVVVKAPFDGPLTVRTDGEPHAIGRKVADCIRVRSVVE
jgi:DtxR family Mn-dependent transcriptional regulator